MIFKSIQNLSYGAGNRRRTAYENMDTDIVQGEEDHHTDDEGETSAVHSVQLYLQGSCYSKDRLQTCDRNPDGWMCHM